jgi:cytochrome c-type biogenesis protein CcmH/NrfG
LNQKTIAAVAVVVLAVLGAYWLGTRSSDRTAPPMPGAQMPVPGGQPLPGGTVPQLPAGAPPSGANFETQQRIAIAEQLVQREPNNVQAWIQLGNDYFDTRQAQKSVDAYAKALALQPNSPDVLTDQGVMYRDLGQFDKAIANFEKAQQLDPRHVQSLYNLGIVWAYDKKDASKATRYFGKVIEMAPGSQQAVQARQHLASMPPP